MHSYQEPADLDLTSIIACTHFPQSQANRRSSPILAIQRLHKQTEVAYKKSPEILKSLTSRPLLVSSPNIPSQIPSLQAMKVPSLWTPPSAISSIHLSFRSIWAVWRSWLTRLPLMIWLWPWSRPPPSLWEVQPQRVFQRVLISSVTTIMLVSCHVYIKYVITQLQPVISRIFTASKHSLRTRYHSRITPSKASPLVVLSIFSLPF